MKKLTGEETVTVAFSYLPPGEKFTKRLAAYQKSGQHHALTGDGDGLKRVKCEPHWQCDVGRSGRTGHTDNTGCFGHLCSVALLTFR